MPIPDKVLVSTRYLFYLGLALGVMIGALAITVYRGPNLPCPSQKDFAVPREFPKFQI